MRMLWAVGSPNTIPYITTVLSELVDRGHDVRVAYSTDQCERRLGKGAAAQPDARIVWLGTLPVRSGLTALEDCLGQIEPDVVAVTNLVDAHFYHGDVVRAARRLGIPAVYVVLSWDHLTNRGRIHVRPDRMVVWNEQQRAEAAERHGIPNDIVTVVGAPRYDRWFGRAPAYPRSELLAEAGLPDRPFVLFAGSSPSIVAADREIHFVQRWSAALAERVTDLSMLVRPHPKKIEAWRYARVPCATVWPLDISRFNTTLFESLCYAAAVVGINTSVMVEATILGKPVLTVLDPALVDAQDGALHFRYLRRAGFLRVAETFDTHARQLREVVDDPTTAAGKARAFAMAFFRPAGFDVRCAPLAADAIERSAA